jgi:molybdopterin molybdotransferase
MRTPGTPARPSCADGFELDSLAADEAMRRIEAQARPVRGFEKVAVRSALGRTLAQDIVSPVNVPAHTNSAMDGYALAGSELPEQGVRSYRVVGTALAGKPYHRTVAEGECVRVMTGAKMPAGTDTVVMQEQVEPEGNAARIGSGHRPGQNVRQAGEDLALGEVAITAGTRIMPAELGLLASLGLAEVRVNRRLRVAFFSTGDEIRSVGEPLREGDVYDSNRYTLYGMLIRLDTELVDMGVIPDSPGVLREAFHAAAEVSDVIITTGGVSVGEADYVKQVLAELGQVDFWKIAIKPGRPLAFGRLLDRVFFGLPGNPVAVMVTFYEFVQPALRRMMGQHSLRPTRLRVPSVSRIKKKPGRTEFLRAEIVRDAAGQPAVAKSGHQGSGILSSMSRASCFIVLPPECAGVGPGELVEVELFAGLV